MTTGLGFCLRIKRSGPEFRHFHKIHVCARFLSLVLSGISEPQVK